MTVPTLPLGLITVTLALAASESHYVTGTPTLSLNDGGTASYVSGSGSEGLGRGSRGFDALSPVPGSAAPRASRQSTT